MRSYRIFSLLCFVFLALSLNARVVFSSTTFEGKKTSEGNQLTWSSASDNSLTHYIVEKSKDGIKFKTVATLPVSKDNRNRLYNYTDRGEKGARVFYRLVEIDVEGNGSFSPSVVFSVKEQPKFELKKVIAASPDTYSGEVFCHVAGNFNYRIMTNMGELLAEGNISMKKGMNDLKVSLGDVEVGTYMMALKLENDIEIYKVRKTNPADPSSDNFAKKQ